MIPKTEYSALPFAEFVALMALMMSLAAFAIDAILPALPNLGHDLNISHVNNNQLVISVVFLGMGVGQLFYGVLSDSVGRKPAMVIGIGIFIVGCLISTLCADFTSMLLGRLLQGIGLGAPRIVAIAIIRDQYEGNAMARVMSFVMTIFILVPMLAPALGQGILLLANWRAIFAVMLILGVVTLCWFVIRQPETLAKEQRAPFSFKQIKEALHEIFTTRETIAYTTALGFLSGAFIAYLSSIQQVLQLQYQLGIQFSLYFAGLAMAIGAASFLNARLVMRFGMQHLSRWAMKVLVFVCVIFCGVAYGFSGQPPLVLLMVYFAVLLFCLGVLFGNLNALAMLPLGHIAGVGASVTGFLATLISLPLGIAIGQAYNGTVYALVCGFFICALVSLIIIRWVELRH